MENQTVTRATEADIEPKAIYDVVAEVSNIPDWAPAFADSVERIDDTHYSVTKDGSTFSMNLVKNPVASTVDYVREMANNRRGGAYIRVTPRPLGGSSITMTVPLAPNSKESDVARTVDQELAEIIRLAQSHANSAR